MPNFADFDPENPKVRVFLERHFPDSPSQVLPRIESGPVGMCYGNVRHKVQREGGSGVTGFLILMIPGYLIEAMHHAVWRKQDGSLADVTIPAYPGLSAQRPALFVLDGGEVQPHDPAVPSRFHAFSKHPAVLDYIRIARDRRLAFQELEATGTRQADGSFFTFDGELMQRINVLNSRLTPALQRLLRL